MQGLKTVPINTGASSLKDLSLRTSVFLRIPLRASGKRDLIRDRTKGLMGTMKYCFIQPISNESIVSCGPIYQIQRFKEEARQQNVYNFSEKVHPPFVAKEKFVISN